VICQLLLVKFSAGKVNELTILSLISSLNERFPNLDWHIGRDCSGIYTSISLGESTSYDIAIWEYGQSDYLQLSIEVFCDKKSLVIKVFETYDIEDMIYSLESWIKEIYLVFNKIYSQRGVE
jgi:hypothetical protein